MRQSAHKPVLWERTGLFSHYFFAFNAECYGTSACQIVTAFRQQFLERFLPQSS